MFGSGYDEFKIQRHQFVCAVGDRDGTLGVSECDTGYLQKCRLLLDATTVGDEQACVLHQAHKLQIADGISEMQVGERLQCIKVPFFGEADACARMYQKDDGRLLRQGVEHRYDAGEVIGGSSNIGGAVHRHQHVGARREAKGSSGVHRSGFFVVAHQ